MEFTAIHSGYLLKGTSIGRQNALNCRQLLVLKMRRSGKHPGATEYCDSFCMQKEVATQMDPRQNGSTDGISPGPGNRHGQRAICRLARSELLCEQLRSTCAVAPIARFSSESRRAFQFCSNRNRRCALRALRVAGTRRVWPLFKLHTPPRP